MRKHAETFHANKSYKLTTVVSIPTLPFSKRKFFVHFSNVICTKTRPYTTLLCTWKWITQLSVPYVTNSFIRSGFSNWSVFSSYNLTPAISQVLIGRHLIFCSPTWPTCCNSPRKYTPVKYKVRQKVGFSTVT